MAVQRSLEALTLALDDIIDLACHNVDSLYIHAKNTSPGAVVKGQVVRWEGSVGATDVPEFDLAKANAAATMPATGITTEGGAVNATVKVLVYGVIVGLDTSTLTEGYPLWVSATTAGGYTEVIPASPNIAQLCGVVLRKHASTGSIFFAPLNQIPSTLTDHIALTTTAHGAPFAPQLPKLVSPCDPRDLLAPVAVSAVNQLRAVRVVCPTSGRLRDLSLYVSNQAGNISVAVYNTASPRVRLYTTGSIACPAVGLQTVVADTGVDVTAGQQLDFALSSDSTAGQFYGKIGALLTDNSALPANFFVSPDGGSPFLTWQTGTAHPAPASVAEASFATSGRYVAIIGRIA